DRPLEELEADVSGEAVADDDVRRALEQLAALDIPAEAELARREERVRLERELVSLLGLLADREQAHVRLRDPEESLREDRAHVAELEQLVGPRVGVRARVEEDGGTASRRNGHRDRGAMDTADPADLDQAGGEHRARVPRGDDRGRTRPHEPARDDEGALGLRAHGVRRLVVHPDRVRGFDEHEPARVEARRAHEDRLDRAGAGLERARDDLVGGMIAAHRVDGYADGAARRVYGAGVRSGSMSRPRYVLQV